MYKYNDDVISHIDYEKYGCIKCGKNIKYTMNKIGFERFLSLYSYCCKECDFHISVVDDAQYTIHNYVEEIRDDMYYINKFYNNDDKKEYDKKINESLEELFSVEDIEYLDGDDCVPEFKMHPRYIEELRNKPKITISKIDLDRFGCVSCKNIYKFDHTKKTGKLVDTYTCLECGKKFEVCDEKEVIEYNLVELLLERINYAINYYYGNEECHGIYRKFLEEALEKLSEVNKELKSANKEFPKIEPHPKKYIKELYYDFKELAKKEYPWLIPQEDLPKIEPRPKVKIIKPRVTREQRDWLLRLGAINLFQYYCGGNGIGDEIGSSYRL